MARNDSIPKIILDLPGFNLENLVRDERWKRFSHLVHNAPGLDAITDLYELEQQGHLSGVGADFFANLVRGLASLIKRVIDGDETAALQLDAVHKMIFPEIFDLQKTHIEKVAKLDRTASGQDASSLARGYAVRR